MKVKKFVALLLAAAMIFSLAACGSSSSSSTTTATTETTTETTTEETTTEEDTTAEETPEYTGKLAEIMEAGKLVVGTSADYPPYEFHTEIDGVDTIVGIDPMVAQYIADKLGVELELVDMSFDGLLISLQKGDFDMVMAALSPTEERKQTVDFTDVFFVNKQIVIIKKTDDDKINTTDDLADLKGGCQSGAIQVDIANMYCDEDNVVALSKFPDLIMELKTGKIDALFTNYLTGSTYIQGNDDLEVKDIGIEWTDLGFAAAVQKSDDNAQFLEVLNDIVKDLQDEGLMDQYIEDAVELNGGSAE